MNKLLLIFIGLVLIFALSNNLIAREVISPSETKEYSNQEYKSADETLDGAVFYNEGNLTIHSSIFKNNQTTESGGTIYTNLASTTTIGSNAIFDYNTANHG